MALGSGSRDTAMMEPDATTLPEGALAACGHRLAVGIGALAVAALAVAFAVECFQIAFSPGRGPLYLSGDQALIAMATRAAEGWHQLLGPYDRFGWHHPGPAYFYLQSFFSRSLASGQAELFGTAVLNGLAAVLTVAVVWRRAGGRAALWAAVCVSFLAIVLGPDVLRWPWNPFVVVIPLCLLAVLCAGAATGSRLCLLGGLLVGSYLVQTDVGTAVVVAAIVVMSLIAHPFARRAGATAPRRPWPRELVLGLAGLGTAVLVLMWVPPLIEQLRGHPGNLTLMWRFFSAGHPHQSLGASLHAVGTVDSELTLGNVDNFLRLRGSHDLVLVLALAVAVAAVAVAVWRRQRFALGLGVASLVGQVVSVIAITRVVGEIFGYLVLWEIALPVVGAIGLGVALLADDGRQPVEGRDRWQAGEGVVAWRGTVVVLVLLTVATASILGVKAARLPRVSTLSATEVSQAWTLIKPQLAPGATSVKVDMGSHDSWPVGAGLADQLGLRGVRPTVPPGWAPIFDTSVATGREDATVVLYQRGQQPPAPPPGGRFLGAAGDTLVYYSPRSPS